MNGKIVFIFISFFLALVFLDTQNSNAQIQQNNLNEQDILSLQKRKLELEIAELERKKNTSWPVEFLNSPIGLTSLTLFFGGLVFSLLSEYRAKQTKKIEKSIQFLDEISKDFNSNLTMLIRYIRLGNFKEDDNKSAEEKRAIKEERDKLFSELQKKNAELFKKRISVKIKSKAFLRSEGLSKQYDFLIWEMGKLLTAANMPLDGEKLSEFGFETAKLTVIWGIDDEIKLNTNLKNPYVEYNYRAEILWLRAVGLMSSEIEALFKSNIVKLFSFNRR